MSVINGFFGDARSNSEGSIFSVINMRTHRKKEKCRNETQTITGSHSGAARRGRDQNQRRDHHSGHGQRETG
ncbi:hypothetical protein DESC_460085 [Desulfosarcina cetonica]|nr:hypothetical protein DESC_460085 [Desulfosarcina cetonica]